MIKWQFLNLFSNKPLTCMNESLDFISEIQILKKLWLNGFSVEYKWGWGLRCSWGWGWEKINDLIWGWGGG